MSIWIPKAALDKKVLFRIIKLNSTCQNATSSSIADLDLGHKKQKLQNKSGTCSVYTIGILTLVVFQDTLWKRDREYLISISCFLSFFTSLAWHKGPSQWLLNQIYLCFKSQFLLFSLFGPGTMYFAHICNCLLWFHMLESHEMVGLKTGSAAWLCYCVVKALLILSHDNDFYHDYKMTVLILNITPALDNVLSRKRAYLSYFSVLLEKRICLRSLPERLPCSSNWLKRGHSSTPKPIIGRGEWGYHDELRCRNSFLVWRQNSHRHIMEST